MVSKDADVAVLHLGTNDALGTATDAQCMLQCNQSVDHLEKAHKQAHPGVPMFVCSVPPTASRDGQRRVDMLNALLWTKCQKSRVLRLLDTGVTLGDIGHYGVHLIPQGKRDRKSVCRERVLFAV